MTLFLALSFGIGFLHAVTPDHWMPFSLRSWQRGWGWMRTLAALPFLVLFHLALAGLLFAVIWPFLRGVSDPFAFSSVFVLGSLLVRAFRYRRVGEVQRAGPRGAWSGYAVASLLGPAESLVPVLVQGRVWGISVVSPILAYAAGTGLALAILTFAGRWVWNRPRWMVRGLAWGVQGPRGGWPASIGLIGLGLGSYFLLQGLVFTK